MHLQKTPLCPVILAGGGGTRLWPLSRGQYPKQFLTFGDELSLLQKTIVRMHDVSKEDEHMAPVLVCNHDHRFLVNDHAEQVVAELSDIILEPLGRNTAPALTIVALKLLESDPVMLVAPADHLIANTSEFKNAVAAGMEQALQNKFVTFGIRPTRPDTGYGYIEVNRNDDDVTPVVNFVEKPDEAMAIQYVNDGNYLWNSGIFMMKASRWLDAIKLYRPDIYSACEAVMSSSKEIDGFYLLHDSFKDCPADSIDYAVMEKLCSNSNSEELVVVKTNPGWTDLGSWEAIFDIGAKDDDDNVVSGNVVCHETRNSVIQSHGRLVATFHCDDVLVVETPDAVLVGDINNSQSVKHIVDKLIQLEKQEASLHQLVHRPWGSYETLELKENYQVKRLIVKPEKKLSLQLHHKRAEHWVVVNGIATITLGDKVFELNENESTYIPLGEKHRLENKQAVDLEVIEVQSGKYLGEDDIVRFEDDFGRHSKA